MVWDWMFVHELVLRSRELLQFIMYWRKIMFPKEHIEIIINKPAIMHKKMQ
jgi:hypothetical protein